MPTRYIGADIEAVVLVMVTIGADTEAAVVIGADRGAVAEFIAPVSADAEAVALLCVSSGDGCGAGVCKPDRLDYTAFPSVRYDVASA
jgi:hypothetical protein